MPTTTFLLLLALPCCLLASHGIASSTASGLFVHAFGSQALPWAWLATGGCMWLSTSMIQWSLARYRISTVYVGVGLVSLFAGCLALVGMWYSYQPAVFVWYMWKDLYVVLLIDLYWTFTNTHFAVPEAIKRYGWFGVMGSLGAIAANGLLGSVVGQLGTMAMALCSLPILALFVLLAWLLRASSLAAKPQPTASALRADYHVGQGWLLLWKNAYLRYLAVVIGCMQWIHALVDVQVGHAIQATFAQLDLRTLAYSQIFLAIGLGSLLLQLLTHPLMRLLGLRGGFWITPVLVHALLWSCWLLPSLWPVAMLRIVSKSFDHSLFKAAKEIAYIPLTYVEKTQAKPLIDALLYRVSKALASFLLLLLPTSLTGHHLALLPLLLSFGWLWLTWRMCAALAAPAIIAESAIKRH